MRKLTFFSLILLASAPVPVWAGGVDFENDVLPVLTRAECNTGACHGKARGQNGFQLSLLAFDADFDYDAIAHEGRGRRVFTAAPERSLLLRKATAEAPHGGGKRLRPGDGMYEVLLEWVADGMPRRPADAPNLERVTVAPTEIDLSKAGEIDLQVTAHYGDGSTRDVTPLATFQSNESTVAGVDSDGRVSMGQLPGEAAVMSRFMNHFAVTRVVIPFPGTVTDADRASLDGDHFIDRLASEKLRELNLAASEPCDDPTFLRRVHLDLIGRLPTPAESRAFIADAGPDKRERLIDALLARPEYADHWANKWADLLRPNPYRVGIKATYNLDAWLRQVFRENWPYDRFVRELLTATGSTFRDGPTVVFRDRRDPDELATMMSQLFLGVRLDCARCHHHPFEVYGQDEFYSFAAYFARIGRKGRGVSPPISGSEEFIYLGPEGGRNQVTHPITGEVMKPRPLFGDGPEIGPDRDPRVALADWVTSPENPFFAKVIVNRVWAELTGRGIVDPVDDLRATNPPTNGPLLDALAERFREDGYDLKKLLRVVTTSRLYGLASIPNGNNAPDLRNYSRFYRQRLRAEVLLDAVSDVTGIPETFAAMPPGSRANQLWTHRSGSLFLDSFGRPDPNQDPPCDRVPETSVVQALHLMNAENLHRKVTGNGGVAAALAANERTPEEIVEELYLLAYCRRPSDEERDACVAVYSAEGATRRQATEDLLWAMMNTPEFTFKH